MYNYLAHTDEKRQEMLREINLESIDDLFKHIKPKMDELNLPKGISEMEAAKEISKIADKNFNLNQNISFLGGGTYNRYVPACISEILGRAEFYTAYTPYQPEVSQGTLQAIFDYQTLICNLTGMDVSNASVYDGATACAEAALMAIRLTKKNKIFLSDGLNPNYIEVVKTYCYGADITVNNGDLKDNINFDEYAGVIAQIPDYLGRVKNPDLYNKINQSSAKFIACIDPVSIAVVKSPSEYGADIVVGDFQQLGCGMNFGGPHGGFLACKEQYLRQLPGRIVGLTKDKEGKEAFTLTLQTREQHIRRDKATSNICTNTALTALAATIYLSALGPEGLKEIFNISIQRAHYFARELSKIPGLSVLYPNFLNEFVLKVENTSAEKFINSLAQKGIFIGINLNNRFKGKMQDCILICVTEMNSINDIKNTLDIIKKPD